MQPESSTIADVDFADNGFVDVDLWHDDRRRQSLWSERSHANLTGASIGGCTLKGMMIHGILIMELLALYNARQASKET